MVMGFEDHLEGESGTHELDGWFVSLVLVVIESFLQSAKGLCSGGFAAEFGASTGSGNGSPGGGGGGGASAVAGFDAPHPIWLSLYSPCFTALLLATSARLANANSAV